MRSILALLRSLTLPYGAGPGKPRIVIGPDVPAPLQSFSRPGVYPVKWQLSGAHIIAAIVAYDANSASDDFFFIGITGGVLSANGYLLVGYCDSTAANSNCYIYAEINPDNARTWNGGFTVEDMDAVGDPRASQAVMDAFNTRYWGTNDGVIGDVFAPFQASYWGTGQTGWSGNAFTASLPLGMVQTTLGARRLFLAASTGAVIAETVVGTWTDNLGNSAITTPSWPVFAGRSYRFRGTFTTQSSTSTDIVSVKVRQQLGGAPVLGTDPILATLGGDGRGLDWFMDQPYEPGSDAILKAYVTMTRAGGAGSVSLFGDGRKSHWCLVDIGAALS